MNMTPAIRDVLPTVKEDAITMRDIERLTGWTGRDVRSAIERERRAPDGGCRWREDSAKHLRLNGSGGKLRRC